MFRNELANLEFFINAFETCNFIKNEPGSEYHFKRISFLTIEPPHTVFSFVGDNKKQRLLQANEASRKLPGLWVMDCNVLIISTATVKDLHRKRATGYFFI